MNRVSIIGGGIIGLCSAYYLQKAGCQVTIFEQNALADGCSMGNAGMIVPSHIIPLAQPGMMAKGLRWMLSPTSPFYVKPRLNADLMRWGWLFYRHSTHAHVERAIPALRDLSLLSKKLYQELARPGLARPGLARPGLAATGDDDGQPLDFGWQERGLLMLYKTSAAEHDMADEADVANRAGIDARILTGQQVQDLEPHARVTVRGGVLYPGDAHLDPGRLVHALIAHLRRQGVTIHDQTTVTGLVRTGGRVTTVQTTTGEFPVDDLVIAGGAWSSLLARKLALRLPLQGGKGYSFMLPGESTPGDASPGVTDNICVPAIMLEARATATPVGNDLRFAGTLEVAGTDRSVNMNRVRGIVQSINQYYPDIRVAMPQVEAVWSGLRPCSPDGLPYVGRVPQAENVVVATGHGMMGLSLGPATGKLVADVIIGNTPAVDLAPFAPGRFAR